MTSFSGHLIVVRGGGDIGSGVIWRLRRVGFPVVVLELERPLTVRRTVAFSSAVSDRHVEIDGIAGSLVESPADALEVAHTGVVAVLASDSIPRFAEPISVLVDARLAKQPLDTTIRQAPLVVALGPGFVAGDNCHVVIETMRGHRLGRAIWEGAAAPNTGIPGDIGGASSERVLRAQHDGRVAWDVAFGDVVTSGQQLGQIDDHPVVSGIDGTVRGLISSGPVTSGLKIGDVDPRFDPKAIDQISDKAMAVGGGVLEAVLVWLNDVSR